MEKINQLVKQEGEDVDLIVDEVKKAYQEVVQAN